MTHNINVFSDGFMGHHVKGSFDSQRVMAHCLRTTSSIPIDRWGKKKQCIQLREAES